MNTEHNGKGVGNDMTLVRIMGQARQIVLTTHLAFQIFIIHDFMARHKLQYEHVCHVVE
jgi:hypothetical protein